MGRAVEAVSEQQSATWDRILTTENLSVYVAESGGAVVGVICLLLLPNLTYDCHPTAFIEPVIVAYDHRRRGVARLMLSQVLEHARAEGCRKVQLLSHKRHAEDGAHQLYRSVGFSQKPRAFAFTSTLRPSAASRQRLPCATSRSWTGQDGLSRWALEIIADESHLDAEAEDRRPRGGRCVRSRGGPRPLPLSSRPVPP